MKNFKIGEALANDFGNTLQQIPVKQFADKTLGELAQALRSINGLVGYSTIQESKEGPLIQEIEQLKKELEELKKKE